MKVLLAEIITDAGTQMREAVNEDTVLDYMQAEDLPPITLFRDEEGLLYLADGFHRYLAAVRANRADINAHVMNGSVRDAILFAVGANAEHGLRRKPEDKRRAVLTMLDDEVWGKWTDSEIARKCSVSHTFVANQRKIHTCNVASMNRDNGEESRTFVHHKTGKPTEMKVGNIGKKKQEEEPPATTPGKISGGITFNVSELENSEIPIEPTAGESVSGVFAAVETLSREQIQLGNARLLRDQLQILRRRVADTHREIQAFAETELGGHLQEYEQSLKNAFDTINRYLKTTEPFCLCFRCGGVGCPVCKQRGWMDRTQHDSRNPPDSVTLI